MLPTLTSLFQGPLGPFQNAICLPAQTTDDVVPARELFSSDGLDGILDRYAGQFTAPDCQPLDRQPLDRQPLDRRALISQWSKYFLSQAIYVPVAANLLLDRHLPLALDVLGLLLDDQGLVTTLVVSNEGNQVAAKDGESRLRPLMDTTLAPAITAMAAHTGIAPRALWSNAGQYYAYLIDRLGELTSPPAAVAEGARLMTLRHFSDGVRNPLYRPVRQAIDGMGEPRCVRQVCCVRYRLPDIGYCGNCPLPAALAEPPEEV